MPFLPITALYASLLAFLLLYLAFMVVDKRRRLKMGLGHQHADPYLLLTGRNHANAAEYIPIYLILLAVAELNGASHWVLHVSGAVFFIARLAHAWGFYQGKGLVHTGRYWGTVFTWLSIIAMGGVNIALSWRYL